MIKRSMIPGIIGMALTIGAIISFDPQFQRWLFLIGAFGMSATAVVERHNMFIGLQMIVLTGTLAAFLPFAPSAKAFLPLAVSIPVLFILASRRMLSTSSARFGALALVILSIGYATQSDFGFFIGGGLVSLYSAIEFRSGFKPALIWFVLNLVFTCFAGAKLVLALSY